MLNRRSLLAAIRLRLMDGYGVEDIALALALPVDAIRDRILTLRYSARLPDIYREARLRRARAA